MLGNIDQRPIVLSGLMGSGKSTVAQALARRLKRSCIDLDEVVVTQTGLSVAQWFEKHGEAEFRRVEAEAVRRLLDRSTPMVVALGGGTVLAADTRRALLERCLLVTLDAPVDELSRRVAGCNERPLLSGGDPAATLSSLLEQRRPAYAECHARVKTQGRDIDDIAQEIQRLALLRCVAVPLAERTYSVWIGTNLQDVLEHNSTSVGADHPVIVVTDTNVEPVGAADVVKQLRARGQRVVEVVLPAGEAHKTLQSVERIWDAALQGGLDRDGLVLAIGGGVVGDLAGFGAATLLRGIKLGQVPTTLLSMVDSSVGGKTGFDRPQGKNLIGAFHQPGFVICDLRWLSTLPRPELHSGLAEVVKAAWIAGPEQVEFLETHAEKLLAADEEALAEAVQMAVQLKARVVVADERESGRRMLLNLGHTVGHAIEALQDFRGMRHGEAVALGMAASAKVGAQLGIGSADSAQRLLGLLQRLGLPVDVAPWLKEPRLFQFVAADKKKSGQAVNYIVAGPPGSVKAIPLPLEKLQKLLTS